ncbi:MAG: hypothetical protein WBA29_05390 [Xanthobacteraceae bacterium]
MTKWMMTAALFLTVAVSGALAQTGRTAPNSVSPNATTPNPGIGTAIPNAPVGHRQPRRGDVSGSALQPDPNDPVTREDAELNRKLKSICRGC